MTATAVDSDSRVARMQGVTLRRSVAAYGFSWRKRSLVRAFTGVANVQFVSRAHDVHEGADLLLWGSADAPAGLPAQVRVIRLEDGFLRSVGLGADLVRPASWVIDASGIYYDARTPSDLETLLQTMRFSANQLQRASVFGQQLVQSGLTKYNLTGAPWSRPTAELSVVLVVGQVETDASIATGTVDVKTNLALLQAVRKARPGAWIVYKPHPDVVAKLRGSGADEHLASQWANEILANGSMAQILQAVDEVHVMTSLAGFEALLRHKPVYCYGQPFYAGWGLTHDRHSQPRRTRRLTLDELIAGCLLIYPVYVSLKTGLRCNAEQALTELLALRVQSPATLPWWRRVLRPLLARP